MIADHWAKRVCGQTLREQNGWLLVSRLAAFVLAWGLCVTVLPASVAVGCRHGGAAGQNSAAQVTDQDLWQDVMYELEVRLANYLDNSMGLKLLLWCVDFYHADDRVTDPAWYGAEELFGVGDRDDMLADVLWRERLQRYGDCLVLWVQRNAELSSDQAICLSQQVQARIDALLPRRAELACTKFDAFMPVLFIERAAPEIDTVLEPEALAMLQLSDAQSQLLQTALAVRQRRLERDHLAGLLFRIDSELFLTGQQTELMTQEAENMFDLSRAGFGFPTGGETDCFQQALRKLLRSKRVRDAMSVHQLLLLQELWGRQDYIRLNVAILRPELPGTLEPYSDQCFSTYAALSAAYIDVFRDQGVVSAAAAVPLQLTCCRVADTKLQVWRRSVFDWSRQLCESAEIDDGELLILQMPFRTDVLLSSEFQDACDSIPGWNQAKFQRVDCLRKQLARFSRGLLDRELWFSKEQRESVTAILQEAVQLKWTAPSPDSAGESDWALGCYTMALHEVVDQRPHELDQGQIRTLVRLHSLFIPILNSYGVIVDGSEVSNSFGTRFLHR